VEEAVVLRRRRTRPRPDPFETRLKQDLADPGPESVRKAEPSIEKALKREPNVFRRWMKILGPGITTGASNNDPSAIATYAQAGAAFGFALLWFAPFVFPMMSVVVFLSAKLALASGSGLSGILRQHYSRWLLYPILGGLATANTITLGADIGAVSEGIGLIFPALRHELVVVVLTALLLVFQIAGSYRTIASVLKWLTFALFAFVLSALLSKPDWSAVVVNTVVPRLEFNPPYIQMIVAMLGCSLSPYLYFWQSSQRVEEQVCRGRVKLWQRKGATDGELHYAAVDINIGMLIACIIIYAIVLSTAATLHATGMTHVKSAAEAARALAPLAGSVAAIIFAIGFIGSGLLAVPVLTGGLAHAICEGCNWKYGLDQTPRTAPAFYVVIATATVAGAALNFSGIRPMDALLLAATINGVLTPPLLCVIMHASCRKSIVGARRNGALVTVVGWLTTAAAIAAVTAMLLTSSWNPL
jgi:NRAMP (natural resistance-associated macrophage protein)-like metal ion transporter